MRPARYHSLRDRVIAQVDAIFAEPVLLAFQKDGKRDPSREPVEVEGVLRTEDGANTSVAGNSAQSWRSRVDGQTAKLHLDPVRYPSVMLRKGDRARALARPGQPWFEVVRVDDRGATRLVATLGEV